MYILLLKVHDRKSRTEKYKSDLLILQNLRCYGNEWIVEIKDITDFIHEQYKHVKSNQLDKLMVAQERVYPVTDKDIAAQIGVDSE